MSEPETFPQLEAPGPELPRLSPESLQAYLDITRADLRGWYVSAQPDYHDLLRLRAHGLAMVKTRLQGQITQASMIDGVIQLRVGTKQVEAQTIVSHLNGDYDRVNMRLEPSATLNLEWADNFPRRRDDDDSLPDNFYNRHFGPEVPYFGSSRASISITGLAKTISEGGLLSLVEKPPEI